MSIDVDYYSLEAAPFRLTPDAGFWFESGTHRKAMAYLGYGLALGEGFIVISGEIGAGKTTLLAHLLQTLDPTRVEAVELRPESPDASAIWRQLGHALSRPNAAHQGDEPDDVLAQIALRARMGKRLLIAVDEAQRLDEAALDQLRMASNAHRGPQPVVQFLLLGQPELREVLARPALEQLSQRVIASHHLEVMEASEIEAYVAHRLSMAGAQGRPTLDAAAADPLFRLSGGSPRRVNQIMARVLLLAAMNEAEIITPDMIETVAAELRDERSVPASLEMGEVEQGPLVGQIPVSDLATRVAALEGRLHAQEAALLRALHLLVDWAEGRAASAINPSEQG